MKSSTHKLCPLKYSCEEVYERMENGLCIFCEEQDSPAHQQLKHKRLRIVMTEREDNLASDDVEEVHQICKTVKNPDPFVETVKNSDPLIEPLECASVSHVLDSASDVLLVHKRDSQIKEREELPQQLTSGNGKIVAHQVFDQIPLRMTSKEKQRKYLKAWKFKFKTTSKISKSIDDRFKLVGENGSRLEMLNQMETFLYHQKSRNLIICDYLRRLSRANRVWKPGGLLCLQDHSGGSVLKIKQQFHGLPLQRIIYMDMKFQEVLVADVLSVMVCLSVHSRKIEAVLDIYISYHCPENSEMVIPRVKETQDWIVKAWFLIQVFSDFDIASWIEENIWLHLEIELMLIYGSLPRPPESNSVRVWILNLISRIVVGGTFYVGNVVVWRTFKRCFVPRVDKICLESIKQDLEFAIDRRVEFWTTTHIFTLKNLGLRLSSKKIRKESFPVEAMHWINLMNEEAAYSHDEKIFYALTSGLCQAKRYHEVIRVLEKLKQSKFSSDLLDYRILAGLFCESKLEIGVTMLLEENSDIKRNVFFGRNVVKWKYWFVFTQMLQAIKNIDYVTKNTSFLEDNKSSDLHGELKLRISLGHLMKKYHSLLEQLCYMHSERKRAAHVDRLVKESRVLLSYAKDWRKLQQWSYHKTWEFKYILKLLSRAPLQNEQHKLMAGRNTKCKMRIEVDIEAHRVLWVKEQKVAGGLITYLEWQAMYEFSLLLGVLQVVRNRKNIACLINTAALNIKEESDLHGRIKEEKSMGSFIKKQRSMWGHLIGLVNGSGRMCDDYKGIIKQTVDDKCYNPLLKNLLDEITTKEVLLIFFKEFRHSIFHAGQAKEPKAYFNKRMAKHQLHHNISVFKALVLWKWYPPEHPTVKFSFLKLSLAVLQSFILEDKDVLDRGVV